MSGTERERKKTALGLAVMAGCLSVFLSVVGSFMMDFQSDLDTILVHAREQTEAYLQLALRINNGFIETLKQEWVAYSNTVGEPDIAYFGDAHISALLPSAYHSVIVTSDGRKHYNRSGYAAVEIDISRVVPDRSVHVLHGERDWPFGSAERVYIAGTELCDGYSLYVGFWEPYMHGNFISTLDVRAIGNIQVGIRRTLRSVYALLVFVLGYGISLVWQARRLQMAVYKDIVEEMGGSTVNGVVSGRRSTDRG